MAKEPIETHCSNPGRDDHWTCPGCYADLGDVGQNVTITCDSCGNAIECTVEYEPACHARVVEST